MLRRRFLFLALAALGGLACARTDAQERAAARLTSQSRTTARVIRQYVSEPVVLPDYISSSDAQALVNAPIARNYFPRNYGSTDVGGKGTAIGSGIPQVPAEPATITTLYGGYGNYASPQSVGYGAGFGPSGLYGAGYGWGYGPYQGMAGGYASYSGIGGGPAGFPIGIRSGLYRPRYFYPYWYYPARTGFSVYNPYFYYGNSYYGGYSAPIWSGYGGFGFPNSFGAYAGFGYPYNYGVYGYPYYNYMRPTHAYMPSYAYFMYPGVGGLYVPPGYFGFPGYYGYGGYGMPLGSFGYGGAFYW